MLAVSRTKRKSQQLWGGVGGSHRLLQPGSLSPLTLALLCCSEGRGTETPDPLFAPPQA